MGEEGGGDLTDGRIDVQFMDTMRRHAKEKRRMVECMNCKKKKKKRITEEGNQRGRRGGRGG